MKNTDQTEPTTELAVSQPLDMNVLLEKAITSQLPAEQLEKLVALSERVQANHAKALYVEAIAKFQSECGPIPRNGILSHLKRSGTSKPVTYARLEEDIYPTIFPVLHRNGLTIQADVEYEGKMIIVITTITHIAGHSKQSKFPCQVDSSGSGSHAQKTAMAVTFGKRQSLGNALGLRLGDDDDPDAQGPPEDTTPITDKQLEEIENAINLTGADLGDMLKYFKVSELEDLTASQYTAAKNILERRSSR